MTLDQLDKFAAYGLFAFALAMAIWALIMDGVHRSEARQLRNRQEVAARRFRDARRRGDTRGQHEAANDAREIQTARLRREVGR